MNVKGEKGFAMPRQKIIFHIVVSVLVKCCCIEFSEKL